MPQFPRRQPDADSPGRSFDRQCARRALAAALLAALLGVAAAAPAVAQEPARDTGRRRPAPVVVPAPTPDRPDSVGPAADDGRWQAGFAIGPSDAGRLFRVQTADGTATGWGDGDRTVFTASRFTAKLDPATGFGLFASRRLGDGPWRLRAEVARATCDIAAEALQGQAGEVFLYDRLTFLTGALAAEARLTSYASHPYASAGLTFCRLTADREGGLDQSGLGVQGALGYRQRLGSAYLGLEAQVRRLGVDLADFRPSAAGGATPDLVYEPSNSLWLMEWRLSLSRVW